MFPPSRFKYVRCCMEYNIGSCTRQTYQKNTSQAKSPCISTLYYTIQSELDCFFSLFTLLSYIIAILNILCLKYN